MAVAIRGPKVTPWNDPSDGIGDIFRYYKKYEWDIDGPSSYAQDLWIQVNTNMQSDEFVAYGNGAYAYPVNASGGQEIFLDKEALISGFTTTRAIYFYLKDEYGGAKSFGGEDAYFSFSLYGDENLTQKLDESSEIIFPSRPLELSESARRLDKNSSAYLNEGDEFSAILPKLDESAIPSVYWEITGNGVEVDDFAGLDQLNGTAPVLEYANRRIIASIKKIT